MLKTTIKTLSLTAALALSAAGAWAQTGSASPNSDTTPPVAPSPQGNSPAPQVSNSQAVMGTGGTTGTNAGTNTGASTTNATTGSNTGMNGNQQAGMNDTSTNRTGTRAARADRN